MLRRNVHSRSGRLEYGCDLILVFSILLHGWSSFGYGWIQPGVKQFELGRTMASDAVDEVSVLVLRFRDLVTPDGDTIRLHRNIIDSKGSVWWGWWSKPGELPVKFVFNKIRRNNGEGKIYLFDSGQKRLYKVVCNGIKFNHPDDGDGKIPASDLDGETPDYYKERSYWMWFRLTAINDAEPAEIEKVLSYVTVEDFFEDGQGDKFEVFDKKVVDSMFELQHQNRTIWFLRDREDDDREHEIILIDPEVTRPEVFKRSYVGTPYNRFLWLTDIHFADFHVFSEESSPMAGSNSRTLESAIDSVINKDTGGDLAGILVSGDVTSRGEKAGFEKGLELIRTLMATHDLIPQRVLVCPGNHDMGWGDDVEPGEPVRRESRTNWDDFYLSLFKVRPVQELVSGGRFLVDGSRSVEIVALNTSTLQQGREFAGHGFVSEQQFDKIKEEYGWLLPNDNLVEKGHRPFRIVMMHHSYSPTNYQDYITDRRYGAILDGDKLLRWLTVNRVDLVLHGHQHANFAAKISRAMQRRDGGDVSFDKLSEDAEWHDIYFVGQGSAGATNPAHMSFVDFEANAVVIRRYEMAVAATETPEELVSTLYIPYRNV